MIQINKNLQQVYYKNKPERYDKQNNNVGNVKSRRFL